MKEMLYRKEKICEILDEGTINKRHYYIISLGTYPLACVELKSAEVKKCSDYNRYKIDVHYGFCYLGDFKWNKKDGRTYLGWSYKYSKDWDGKLSAYENQAYNNKPWSTQEILEDVKKVIDKLNKGKFVEYTYTAYAFECEEKEDD